MSLMKTLEAFIADNPGLTSREIAEAFACHSVDSVQRAVCRLHDYNFATRVMHGNQYRYYVVGWLLLLPVDQLQRQAAGCTGCGNGCRRGYQVAYVRQ